MAGGPRAVDDSFRPRRLIAGVRSDAGQTNRSFRLDRQSLTVALGEVRDELRRMNELLATLRSVRARTKSPESGANDPWLDPITTWLAGGGEKAAFPRNVICGRVDPKTRRRPVVVATTADILQYALHLKPSKHTRRGQMQVGRIMRALGWQKSRQIWNAGRPVRPWVRPQVVGSLDLGET